MATARDLRHQLAGALIENGRPAEGIDQLTRAMDEPGCIPSDAEMLAAIGAAHERLKDPTSAVEAYLRSTSQDAACEAAVAGSLRLLRWHPQGPRSTAIDAAVTSAVQQTPRAAPAAHRLAGLLLRRGGNLEAAAAAFDRALAGAPDNAEAVLDDLVDTLLEIGDVAAARHYVEAHPDSEHNDAKAAVLLEEGRFAEALAAARDSTGPLSRAAEIYALIGLGRAKAAVQAGGQRKSTDVIVARIAAHLALADYAGAQELTEKLGHDTGSNPAAVLIRAQVLFESAGSPDGADKFGDVDEARRALDRLRRVDATTAQDTANRLLRHRWIRLQQCTRPDDDRWQYALTEATVALDPDPVRQRAAVARAKRVTTTVVQDAALSELAATTADRQAGAEQLAALMHRAAVDIHSIDDPARSLPFAKDAVTLDPTVLHRCTLAELSWRVSYLEEDDTVGPRLSAAIAELDAEHGSFPPDAGSRAAELHGLCLSRLAELTRTDQIARSWRAATFMLAAALGTTEGYYYAHASFAFGRANARGSALACGLRARELEPDDWWVAETAVVVLVNHLADYDRVVGELDKLAQRPEWDHAWARSVLEYTAVLNGRTSSTESAVDASRADDSTPVGAALDTEFDADWARWAVIARRVIADGVLAAAAELTDLAARLANSGNDPEMQADVYRCLGRFDDADAVIDEALSLGVIAVPIATSARALTQLAREASAEAEAVLADQLGRELTPARLRARAHVDLPLVQTVRPDAQPAVERLIAVCETRLAELLRDPPALLTEVLLAPSPTPEPALLPLLLDLLMLESQAAWVAIAHRLSELAEVRAAGALMPALVAIRKRLGTAVAAAAIADIRTVGDITAVERVERLRDVVGDEPLVRARLESWWWASGSSHDDLLRAVPAGVDSAAVARVFGARIAAEAGAGDLPGARRAYVGGLACSPDVEVLDEELAIGTTTVEGYRVADTALADAAAAGEVSAEVATQSRKHLVSCLDTILGLHTDGGNMFPYITPVVVEVGDDLVPLVDPNLDGGTFINDLIPRMKTRVFESMGVRPPGVRLRLSQALAADQFVVLVDGVAVLRGTVPTEVRFAIKTAETNERDPKVGWVRYHPLTAQRGVWAVSIAAADATGDTLAPREYLLLAIETALRSRLTRFVGPDEVSELVDEWRTVDERSLHVDGDDVLALTWVIQHALEDGVSVVDWRGLLAAVETAGGLGTPEPNLRRTVRRSLRGPATSEPVVTVPELLQYKLGTTPPEGREEFTAWLREQVAEQGPILTLTSQEEDVRARVNALARAEFPLVESVIDSELTR
ncbi:MAG: FHIPEP family type III secretion protein [Jatrophihabitantaceae bacterium]